MFHFKKQEQGFAAIEVILVIVLFAGILAWIFRITWHTTDIRQLGQAKQLALNEAMVAGGLTDSIKQDVINILVSAGLSPSQINVSSPQGLNPKLSLGTKIEIDIVITTNPAGGLDNNGHVTSTTDTITAKGYTISQYYP